jgi:hypothetical protein
MVIVLRCEHDVFRLEFEEFPGLGKTSFTDACYDSTMDTARRLTLIGSALCVIAALLAPTRAAEVVLVSKSPYWAVGQRDERLSRACSHQRFNLKRSDNLVARFVGPEGAGTLGVAKGNGNNLYDPKQLRKPTEDYFFYNQNTTSCEVFVGGRGKKAGPQLP